jgi:hypothetical protein
MKRAAILFLLLLLPPPATDALADPPRAQAKPAPTHLEPVGEPHDLSYMRENFPEAFTDDAVAWMDAGYAFGARNDLTILKRTEQGFRLVYIDTPMVFGDDFTGGAAGYDPKPARCVYDIPRGLGRRILEAARAVLRETRDSGDKDIAPLGASYEFFARDGAKALRGKVDNPGAGSEPDMLASVLTPFEHTCPSGVGYREGDIESALGQLERRIRKEKPR